MEIELIKQVRSPAHLVGEVGDILEVSTGDGETLINSEHAKKKGKGKKDGEITEQKDDPGSG